MSLEPPRVIGLCLTCIHSRVVENRRGSRFYLCELSGFDPVFPRYPALPVVRCAGYRPVLRDEGEA